MFNDKLEERIFIAFN